MSKLDITIRPESPNDYNAVLRLTYEAFLTLNYPEKKRMDEHFLIHLLRDSDSVIPELCFLAEYKGEIVGHILYTKSSITRPDGSQADTVTFGPLSVLPKVHKRGVGAALVRHSMAKAREMGQGAVLIVGVPDYYPKLGFKRAREYGLTFADGSSIDPFMAYELKTGFLGGGAEKPCGGIYSWSPEFDIAENDDEGYGAFNRHFMAEYYPGQLTVRPFFGCDIVLMERWLYTPHVAKWYKYPEHWLDALHNRFGEFSFITPLIAEYEGVPVGFCRYYDCYYAKNYDIWKEELPNPQREGEVHSMDILIGESDYLHRGFGKQMVALMLEQLRSLGAKAVVVEPELENIASRSTLEASGFKWDEKNYILELETKK